MIPAGATLMIGGFMGVGTPEPLVDELVRQEKGDLTVIANDTAAPGIGIGKLVDAGLLRRVIVSHIGLNPETQRQMLAGKPAGRPRPAGHACRAHPRRRLRPRRHPDADRRRHGRRGGQAEDRGGRPTTTCWSPRCGPTSRSCTPSSPTTWATSPTPSRRAISIR